jgi:hypothetical protein
MNEAVVRDLVREVVARHLARSGDAPAEAPVPVSRAHPSHGQYLQLLNATDACLIEPAVLCNHCGYCKSHGH